jgi:hypothetical protein
MKSFGCPAGRPLAATFARGLLKLVIAGCFALFTYVAFAWITPTFDVKFAAIYDNWGLAHPRSGVFFACCCACMLRWHVPSVRPRSCLGICPNTL